MANLAAGRGNTFAYTGAAGTAPLPIFQAYFAGTPLANAANQNPASYTVVELHELGAGTTSSPSTTRT